MPVNYTSKKRSYFTVRVKLIIKTYGYIYKIDIKSCEYDWNNINNFCILLEVDIPVTRVSSK